MAFCFDVPPGDGLVRCAWAPTFGVVPGLRSWQAERVFVMRWDRFELRVFSWIERLALLPCVLAARDDPKIPLVIPHDPLLVRAVDVKGKCPYRVHGRSSN